MPSMITLDCEECGSGFAFSELCEDDDFVCDVCGWRATVQYDEDADEYYLSAEYDTAP